MSEQRCVALTRGRPCQSETRWVDLLGPVPLCTHHAREMYVACLQREREMQAAEREQQRRDERLKEVYYARRERDGHIKIGYSGNPPHRMRQIATKHGHMSLLATHLGGPVAEAAQHLRWAEYRRDGEFFAPADPLLAHVEHVRARELARCRDLRYPPQHLADSA